MASITNCQISQRLQAASLYQISERLEKSKPDSRGLETPPELAVKHSSA